MPRGRTWLTGLGALAALAAGALTALVVSGAAAGGGESTVTVEGSLHRAVTISGSSGDDAVGLSSSNGSVITISSENIVNQRTDCTGPTGTGSPVFCNGHGETQRVVASLLTGRDSFDVASLFPGIKIRGNGQGGRDRLTGGPGPESFNGAGSPDRLLGRGGNDKLRGQGGDDRIRGGGGRDRCVGGPGRDDIAGCD